MIHHKHSEKGSQKLEHIPLLQDNKDCNFHPTHLPALSLRHTPKKNFYNKKF